MTFPSSSPVKTIFLLVGFAATQVSAGVGEGEVKEEEEEEEEEEGKEEEGPKRLLAPPPGVFIY